MTIRLPRIPRRFFIGIIAGILLIIPATVFILAASKPAGPPPSLEIYKIDPNGSPSSNTATNGQTLTMSDDGTIHVQAIIPALQSDASYEYVIEVGDPDGTNRDEFGSITFTIKNGVCGAPKSYSPDNKRKPFSNFSCNVGQDGTVVVNIDVLTSVFPKPKGGQSGCDATNNPCYAVFAGDHGQSSREKVTLQISRSSQSNKQVGEKCDASTECLTGLICQSKPNDATANPQKYCQSPELTLVKSPTPIPSPPSPIPEKSISPVISPIDGPILPLIPSAPSKSSSPSPKIPVVVPILTPIPSDQSVTVKITNCAPGEKDPQLRTDTGLDNKTLNAVCTQNKKAADKNGTVILLDSATCKATFDKSGLWHVYATCNGQNSETITVEAMSRDLTLSVKPNPPVAGAIPNVLIATGCPAGENVKFIITEKSTSPAGNPTHNTEPPKDVLSEKFPDTNRNEARLPYLNFKVNKNYDVTATCEDDSLDDHEDLISFSVTEGAEPEVFTEPGSCEICPVDWPIYDETKSRGKACLSKDGDGESAGRYQIDPIQTDTCSKGYICDHAIGCVIPSPGIEPPKQPCQDSNATLQNCKTALGAIDTSAGGFIKSLLGILMSVSGMIALYLIVRSGYQLMTSRGNPEAIQEARERLTSAIVGLLLIIFSLVILSVIGVDLLKIPGFS